MLCSCKVCKSKDPKNKRLRASVWIQTRGKSFLIDTSADLRQQTLTRKIDRVDAVLYTHPHADHISGVDEMRAFSFVQKNRIPVYAHDWTAQELTARYPYIFTPTKIEGGAIALLDMNLFNPEDASLEVLGVPFVPIPAKHGSKVVVGYRIDTVAYLTDCNSIPDLSFERLKGLSTLVLDCVRLTPHNTHFHLEQALQAIEKIAPKKTYLTHLGHDFDYKTWQKKLPKNVHLAYDGLQIKW